jgi:transposase
MELHRTWNAWKKQPGTCAWWSENSKCAYQEAFRDLDRACNAYWRARRVGRRVGFPRFKKKGRADHFRLTDPVRVQPRAVVLPRIGAVRTKEATTKLHGRILSATCRREADRWFVSLCVRTNRPDPVVVDGPQLVSTGDYEGLGYCLMAVPSRVHERWREDCGSFAASTRDLHGSARGRGTEQRRGWRLLGIIAE